MAPRLDVGYQIVDRQQNFNFNNISDPASRMLFRSQRCMKRLIRLGLVYLVCLHFVFGYFDVDIVTLYNVEDSG
jgi:hypothetical protein